MRKTMLVVTVAALCTVKTATAAAAQTLDVVGLDGKTVAATLDTLERRTIVKGPALARVIIASAPDGYRVAYAIAELDAALTDQVVLVADRRDGRTLLPDTGPLQVVVPNDKRPARWIRQVNKIEVRQLQ